MFPIEFESKIDIGHFLTFLTLVVGFCWWLYTSVRAWRQKSNDDARSGALRLLLKILRDHEGKPITIDCLYEQFHSPEMESIRRTYCGRNYRFKTTPLFEAAIYRLDWEGKVDFPSPNEVVFRVDRHVDQAQKFIPTESDKEKMLKTLQRLLADEDLKPWDMERIAESCMRAAPAETAALLREKLHASDPRVSTAVVHVLYRLLPDHA